MTAHEHGGWLRFGGGQELWEEAYAKAGVQPLLAGTTGPQAGGWFKREIKSLDDLKGLKMRAGGMGRDVLTRLGVDAILTPPGEITAAMASGRLDAVEWNGPWNDREAGLHKLALTLHARRTRDRPDAGGKHQQGRAREPGLGSARDHPARHHCLLP